MAAFSKTTTSHNLTRFPVPPVLNREVDLPPDILELDQRNQASDLHLVTKAIRTASMAEDLLRAILDSLVVMVQDKVSHPDMVVDFRDNRSKQRRHDKDKALLDTHPCNQGGMLLIRTRSHQRSHQDSHVVLCSLNTEGSNAELHHLDKNILLGNTNKVLLLQDRVVRHFQDRRLVDRLHSSGRHLSNNSNKA